MTVAIRERTQLPERWTLEEWSLIERERANLALELPEYRAELVTFDPECLPEAWELAAWSEEERAAWQTEAGEHFGWIIPTGVLLGPRELATKAQAFSDLELVQAVIEPQTFIRVMKDELRQRRRLAPRRLVWRTPGRSRGAVRCRASRRARGSPCRSPGRPRPSPDRPRPSRDDDRDVDTPGRGAR